MHPFHANMRSSESIVEVARHTLSVVPGHVDFTLNIDTDEEPDSCYPLDYAEWVLTDHTKSSSEIWAEIVACFTMDAIWAGYWIVLNK